jgi:hypothetical protein
VSETRSIAVLDAGRALRFPRECPHCSRTADTRVRVTKIFARRTRRGIVWIHYHIDMLACAACASEHEAIVRPDPATVRQAGRRQAFHVLPIILAGGSVLGGGVLLASFGVVAAGRQTSAFASSTIAALGFGIAGIGLGLMGGGWIARRAIVLPADWPDAQYAVDVPSLLGAHTIIAAPVSLLTRAVDFSDDRSAPDEPPWRTFAFARDSYAQEFARLNAHQVYDRLHPAPRSLVRNRRTLYYVAAAALTAAVVWAVWG